MDFLLRRARDTWTFGFPNASEINCRSLSANRALCGRLEVAGDLKRRTQLCNSSSGSQFKIANGGVPAAVGVCGG